MEIPLSMPISPGIICFQVALATTKAGTQPSQPPAVRFTSAEHWRTGIRLTPKSQSWKVGCGHSRFKSFANPFG